MQACEELSISDSALHQWMETAAVETEASGGLTAAAKAEWRELKRELQPVKMERDILRKARAFFAQGRRAGT